MRRLTREALSNPINVTIGATGQANADVQQSVLLMADAAQKQQWLQARLAGFVDEGQVLVFAGSRATVEKLAAAVQSSGYKAAGLHGDLDQHTRMQLLAAFKAGSTHVLVATDVAARGLDIRTIATVVNYDVARDIDTHVHRIGRTGRAGDKEGTAVTLLLPHESRMAAALVDTLESVGQPVPKCACQVIDWVCTAVPHSRHGRQGLHECGLLCAPGRCVGGSIIVLRQDR